MTAVGSVSGAAPDTLSARLLRCQLRPPVRALKELLTTLESSSVDHRPLAMARLTSLADTDRLAEALHEILPSRCVLGIVGTLGAGKTRLTQAFAVAAGVPQADVTSPTFTLVHRYRAERLIYHIDAYRIADEDEFWELGVDEMFEDQAVTIVEWADRVAEQLPPESLWIQLSLAEREDVRFVQFSGRGSLWNDRLRQIPMLQSST